MVQSCHAMLGKVNSIEQNINPKLTFVSLKMRLKKQNMYINPCDSQSVPDIVAMFY